MEADGHRFESKGWAGIRTGSQSDNTKNSSVQCCGTEPSVLAVQWEPSMCPPASAPTRVQRNLLVMHQPLHLSCKPFRTPFFMSVSSHPSRSSPRRCSRKILWLLRMGFGHLNDASKDIWMLADSFNSSSFWDSGQG